MTTTKREDTVSHALAHEERADRLEARVERLEKAIRELQGGATHVTDAAVTPFEGPTHRYMGDRTIVHRKAFDGLFAALTETDATLEAAGQLNALTEE